MSRRTRADLLAVPDEADWDVPIFAAKVGASPGSVHLWIAQGRLRVERREITPGREVTIVLDRVRPPRAVPGTLSPEARAAVRQRQGDGFGPRFPVYRRGRRAGRPG